MRMRQSQKEFAWTIFWIILLVVVVLWLNLPWNPTINGIGPDSGVYAYIGSAIVHGKILYRDVWEPKPPVGLYLNALAIIIFGQNLWAVWWFNLIWVAVSSTFFFLVLKKMLGLLVGCIASIVYVLGVMVPSIFQNGNLLEIYGFLPQILIIGCTYYFFATNRNRWIFLGGVSCGIAFLTKQTTIALGVSLLAATIVIAILRRQYRDLFLRSAYFISGFLIPLGIATFYWLAIGSIKEYLAGVFLYGFSYAGVGAPFLWSIKHTFVSVFPPMFISKLYFIAVISFLLYLAGNLRWFFNRMLIFFSKKFVILDDDIPAVELTLLSVYIALPIEIVFASLGGRNYGHYFLSLLPAVTTAIAYVFWKAITFLHRPQFKIKDIHAWLAVGGIILGLASLSWMVIAILEEAPTLEILASFPKVFSVQPSAFRDVSVYIDEMTKPNDPVLVWNSHATINFLADRFPPQRVLSPLYFISSASTGGPISNQAEFLDEFEANPPKLIIARKNDPTGLPFVDVPVDQMCPKGACAIELAEAMTHPGTTVFLQALRQYFLDNYTLSKQMGELEIYERVH